MTSAEMKTTSTAFREAVPAGGRPCVAGDRLGEPRDDDEFSAMIKTRGAPDESGAERRR
jgi:hypothetical protein